MKYTVQFKSLELYVRANSVKEAKQRAEQALCQPKGSAITAKRGVPDWAK